MVTGKDEPSAPAPRTSRTRKGGPGERTDWQAPFLEHLAQHGILGEACRQAHVDPKTMRSYRAKHEEFKLAVADAQEHAADTLERVLRARATVGQPVRKTVTRTLANGDVEVTETVENVVSNTLGMFILKRYRPEFRERSSVEHSGTGGGPIRIKVDQEALDGAIAGLLQELAG